MSSSLNLVVLPWLVIGQTRALHGMWECCMCIIFECGEKERDSCDKVDRKFTSYESEWIFTNLRVVKWLNLKLKRWLLGEALVPFQHMFTRVFSNKTITIAPHFRSLIIFLTPQRYYTLPKLGCTPSMIQA